MTRGILQLTLLRENLKCINTEMDKNLSDVFSTEYSQKISP